MVHLLHRLYGVDAPGMWFLWDVRSDRQIGKHARTHAPRSRERKCADTIADCSFKKINLLCYLL